MLSARSGCSFRSAPTKAIVGHSNTTAMELVPSLELPHHPVRLPPPHLSWGFLGLMRYRSRAIQAKKAVTDHLLGTSILRRHAPLA
jgi:hypothetical protein